MLASSSSSASQHASTPSTPSPASRGFQLLRPVKGEDRYFVVTRWADEESYKNWWAGEGKAAHAHKDGEEPRKPVASGAELLEFEVVLDSLEQD